MFVIIIWEDSNDKKFSKMLKGFGVKYTTDFDDDSYYYYFDDNANENEKELIDMILNQCDIEHIKI
jgi:hypothetical protein